MFKGLSQMDDNSAKIIADEIVPMEKAEEIWTAEVRFRLDIHRTDRLLLENLRDLIRRHPGPLTGLSASVR